MTRYRQRIVRGSDFFPRVPRVSSSIISLLEAIVARPVKFIYQSYERPHDGETRVKINLLASFARGPRRTCGLWITTANYVHWDSIMFADRISFRAVARCFSLPVIDVWQIDIREIVIFTLSELYVTDTWNSVLSWFVIISFYYSVQSTIIKGVRNGYY